MLISVVFYGVALARALALFSNSIVMFLLYLVLVLFLGALQTHGENVDKGESGSGLLLYAFSLTNRVTNRCADNRWGWLLGLPYNVGTDAPRNLSCCTG